MLLFFLTIIFFSFSYISTCAPHLSVRPDCDVSSKSFTKMTKTHNFHLIENSDLDSVISTRKRKHIFTKYGLITLQNKRSVSSKSNQGNSMQLH